MISLILVFLTAGCNAIMDSITHHWHKSVFNGVEFDANFWNPQISWKNKYNNQSFDFFSDAWHIFKSSMIVLLALAIVFYSPMINWFVDIILIGVVWNFSFNWAYNHYLNKK